MVYLPTGKLRRKLLLGLVCVALLGLVYLQFSGISVKDFLLDFTEHGFAIHDYFVRQDMHYSKYRYHLEQNFTDFVGGDLQEFSHKSQQDKCLAFFDFLDKTQPSWEVSRMQNREYDKNLVKKGLYFKDSYKKLEKQKGRDPSAPITLKENMEVNDRFLERILRTKDVETEMADLMTVIRTYGHCFFGGDGKLKEKNEKAGEMYSKYNRKMIPFFQATLPHFEAPNAPLRTDGFPGGPEFQKGDDLLDYYYKNMEGKGIVISGATRYSRDIVKLIRVFRALNNRLPIQIVYRGDLLIKSKQAIMGAAISSTDELFGSNFSDVNLLKRVLPEIDISAEAQNHGFEFPKQHVTFVNVKAPLLHLGKSDFASYNNKILALFFNSFEEVILFDADTVPLLAPQGFFDLKEYSDTGAYFFRDRSLRDSNDWIETNFFAKLMPHDTDAFDMALGISPVTEHTLDNPYLRGWRHSQEAGLLVFNKKRHITATLVLFPLLLWGEPIRSSIWGDKEMYWLAMSIAGDENYTFNKYHAASIGEVTSEDDRKLYNNTVSSEVCSSHPGHISLDGALLWVNSGFLFCKKNGFLRDLTRFPFSAFGEKGDLQKLYEEPLRIRNAIVPPDLPHLRPQKSPPNLVDEIQYVVDVKKRKKDVDQIDANQIEDYNPQKGWVKSSCCSNYYYCAYNAIESYDNSGKIDDSGVVFTFTDEERKKFDILGKVWITGIKNMRYNPPVQEGPPRDVTAEKEPQTDNKTDDPIKAANEPAPDQEKDEKSSVNISLSEKTEAQGKVEGQDENVEEATGSNFRILDHIGNVILQPAWLASKLNSQKQDKRPKLANEEVPATTTNTGTTAPASEETPGFDVQEKPMGRVRPEKLNNDVKALLEKLKNLS